MLPLRVHVLKAQSPSSCTYYVLMSMFGGVQIDQGVGRRHTALPASQETDVRLNLALSGPRVL